MEGVSLVPSQWSSSPPPSSSCRKVTFTPYESSLPQRFSQFYVSCVSFTCPCTTSLQCPSASAGGVSTTGGNVHGSQSICSLSQSCTLLLSLPLPHTHPPCLLLLSHATVPLCSTHFPVYCRDFYSDFRHHIVWKCNPSCTPYKEYLSW